ncbi:hypothetical protein POTOM_001545 [Populus tomentosa]|uniref:Uncharacterized protein n=1 Tax=Populus tomentosa TaxID=118781 RepID=A0A8X8DI87_POPTO|nr:hypothetical protein POTOM_001545 [Populus tomentosa]
MIVAEDIGRQFLTYGERKPVEHFLKVVDEITLDDITSIGCSLIRSPLTMASYGNVLNVPSYESVSSRFERRGKLLARCLLKVAIDPNIVINLQQHLDSLRRNGRIAEAMDLHEKT